MERTNDFKYSVIDISTGDTAIRTNDRAAAEKFLMQKAYNENYGLFRKWSENGWDYYDVGAQVFRIQSDDAVITGLGK